MPLPAGVPGIGVDLCEVARIEKSLRSEAFIRRVFAPAERELLATLSGTRRAQSAAANFAAKEAFLKAAGTGLAGFEMAEIAVLRGESGAPYLRLFGTAAAWAAENGILARVSLTHEAGLACAFVVLEQTQKPAAL